MPVKTFSGRQFLMGLGGSLLPMLFLSSLSNQAFGRFILLSRYAYRGDNRSEIKAEDIYSAYTRDNSNIRRTIPNWYRG